MDKLQSSQISDQSAVPVLTAGQLAEVMDTSVHKVRKHISRFNGAVKLKGRWNVPASTIHGFLACFTPKGRKVEAGDLVFTWFWITMEFGFPEQIPTFTWLTDKHRLIDRLSGCSCGRT